MAYQCSRCGRAFNCDETISFCPFCGTAYARQNAIPQPITTRVVIGSDSERTVQEKYWRMARNEIRQILFSLDVQIPDEDEYEEQQLDLNEWLQRQKRCRSTSQFKKHCDEFLYKISSAMQDVAVPNNTQAPIDIERIGREIERTCSSLARTLGKDYLPDALPALRYEAVPLVRSKKNSTPHVSEAYHKLLNSVEYVKPVLYSILDENGIFVALSVLGNLSPEDAVKRNPIDLSTQLRSLAEKDYDPLFGEEYDDFVQAFWEAILRLAYIVNDVLALPELDEEEIAKIVALQTYLSDWQNILNVMLDQVYQSQQQDMVCLHQRIQKTCSNSSEEKNY